MMWLAIFIVVFYMVPVIINYESMLGFYSEGGIGEGRTKDVMDWVGPLIPFINIYTAIMCFFIETKKRGADIPPRQMPPPPPKPKKDDDIERVDITFNF